MKTLGNVLYILTEGSYLYCQNETIAVKIGGTDKARIPAHTIESIVCLTNTTVSTPFISFCGERGIGLSFHSDTGKFYGRISGSVHGNVLLRKAQYNTIGTTKSVEIVKNILTAKFYNSRCVLLKSARDCSEESAKLLRTAAESITNQHKMILDMSEIDNLRGIEGVVANTYFGVFDNMLKTNDEDMKFVRRSRRPPENRVNAMLSFTYMLLKNDIQSALESVGIDPAAGYLHTLRPGRPSMALDLMEELRSPLCDRLVISLINLKQIKSDDFDIESGEYRLSDNARRTLIDKWQKRKREEIIHPFFDKKIPIGLIPYCQSMLLARKLRNEIEEYPPFIWR